MSQETNNSDTVSIAQTTENHDQTEAKTTIAGDQSTLTFGGQDETEKSINAQTSFGDYDREIGQETILPHCQIQAPPGLSHRPKVNKRATQKAQNKRKTLEK
jgi:hypothetical protein